MRQRTLKDSRPRMLAVMVFALALLAAACGAPGGEEEAAPADPAADGTEQAAETEAPTGEDTAEDTAEEETAPETEEEEGAAEGSDEPIDIGFLAATTGVAASSGQDMVRGWDLYWEVNGDEVAGRTIRTHHEDTAGDPAVGLNKARRLVESVGVDLVVGPLFANVGYALAEYLSGEDVPNFQQVSSADDLTQRQRYPGVLRVAGWTSSQPMHPLGQYAADEGHQRVVTLCVDYAFGHEECGGFVNTFTDAGGEIIEQLWNPLGTQDFGTYITQVQAANPDAVYVVQVGGDSVRFIESWNSFGMKGQIPLYGGETLLDQSLLRNMGAEAEGLISGGKYAEGREEPATQEFVEAFDEAYGELPSYYASVSYTAAQWTALALEECGCPIEETEEFLEAVRNVEIEASPGGPMRLDDYDNPIQNAYIREVQQREDGRLWNVPIETYEEVSQFWTYDPEEFLDHPVYSRDYQGDGVWPEPQG